MSPPADDGEVRHDEAEIGWSRGCLPKNNTVAFDVADLAEAKVLEGDLHGAVEGFGRALEEESRWPTIWLGRARARLKAGDPEGAEADCTAAIQMQPAIGEAFSVRSEARDMLGNLAGALSDLSEALRCSPGFAMAWAVRGGMRLRSGDLNGAVEDCTEAIRLDPQCSRAYTCRGMANLQLEHFFDAAADTSKALTGDASLLDAWITRAAAQLQMGMLQNVLSDCARAMRILDGPDAVVAAAGAALAALNPEAAERAATNSRARTLELRAGAMFGQGELHEACADCHLALDLDPTLADAVAILGYSKLRQRDFEGAIKFCTRAIQLLQGGVDEPLSDEDLAARSTLQRATLAMAWAERGQARLALFDFASARADASEAIRLCAVKAEFWCCRGIARLQLGETEGSVEDCSEAIKLDARSAEAWATRGKAYLKMGDPRGALVDSQTASDLNKLVPEVWDTLAAASLDVGRPEDALIAASNALELNPRLADSWATRGGAKLDLFDLAGAEADCSEALRLNPSSAAAHLNRAGARYDSDDSQGALLDCDETLKLRPEEALVWARRGRVKVKLGDLEGARSDLDEALSRDDGLVEAWTYRAEARRLGGDLTGAIEDCNKALALRPDYAAALSTRGQAKSGLQDHLGAIHDCKEAQRLDPPSLSLKKSDWTHMLCFTKIEPRQAINALEASLEWDASASSPEGFAARLRQSISRAELAGGVDEELLERGRTQLAAWLAVLEEIKTLEDRHADADARKEAARRLGELGDPSAVPALGHAVSHDKDKYVRYTAMQSLGRLDRREALEILDTAIHRAEKHKDKVGVAMAQCAKLEIMHLRKGIEELMAGKPGTLAKAACEEALHRLDMRHP